MLKFLIYMIFLTAALTPSLAHDSNDEMGHRPVSPKPHTRAADECGTHAVSRYIGSEAIPAVRKAIASASGHDRIRWITAGSAVTLDVRPDRLNIILDQAGRILTMRCG